MTLVDVQWNPNHKQLRGFGIVFAVMCLLLGGWARFGQRVMWVEVASETAVLAATGLWIAAAACASLAAVAPAMLRPLYLLLTAIGFPIGLVVGHLLLALIFFFVFTPIALVFRLCGRDALQRSRDPAAPSYWTPKKPVVDANRYFRQF